MSTQPNVIVHYGVKGMKWGVTRAGKTRPSPSEDHSTSRSSMRKRPSQMSNSELRKLNERLQLEKTNRELQSRGALQKIKAGTAVAGTILAVGTTMTTAYNFSKGPVGQQIIGVFKK